MVNFYYLVTIVVATLKRIMKRGLGFNLKILK